MRLLQIPQVPLQPDMVVRPSIRNAPVANPPVAAPVPTSTPMYPDAALRRMQVGPASIAPMVSQSGLLGGSAGDFEGLTPAQIQTPVTGMSADYQDQALRDLRLASERGLLGKDERPAKKVAKKVSGLLTDSAEGDAALQGLFATLTAMGRPVKRGESRTLGAVELGRQVYGQELDRALKQQEIAAKRKPADRFRPLSAAEKQAIGISEFQPAQINLTTGEIDTFGGGLNYQGTLEQGTELFRTESGGIGVRPIQGSKGARAQTAERTAEEMALVGKNTSYNRVMNLTGEIAELLNQGEGEFGVTGISGQVVGALGLAGTDRKSLEKKYGTLRANIGFDRLQQMRDESPTGGALGQVAVQELDALQSSLDALDPNLKPEEQMASLRDVQKHYENVLILSAMATRADDSEWDEQTLKKLGVFDDVQNILIRRSADEYGISEQDLRDAIEDPDTRDLFPILSIDQAFSGFQVPELRQ